MTEKQKPQTIVITGATGGIGSAIAREFARYDGDREWRDCTIVLCDLPSSSDAFTSLRNELHTLRAQRRDKNPAGNIHIVTWICDVTDAAKVFAVADAIAKINGGIDVLVNAAGIMPKKWLMPLVRADQETLKDMRLTMDVNYWGTLYWCRAVLPYMREAGYGRIVNIASIAAHHAEEGNAVYGGSKAAVVQLTQTLATEVTFNKANPAEALDIRVNVISPGITATPMTTDVVPEKAREHYMRRNPIHRDITPEEVAYWVRCLASRRASGANGATLVIDGGYLIN